MTNWLASAWNFLRYRLVEVFVRPSSAIKPDSLLLIRTDAIGDYILFRNFLQVLKESPKYRGYEITLVGNKVWQELAEHCDSAYVSRFIWIDLHRFEHSLIYRAKKLRQITSTGYSVLINTLYSRSYHLSDTIAKVTAATEKIAHEGDRANISERAKLLSDRYYTRLIPATAEVLFEFYQNRRFFEQLLDQKVDLKQPAIQLAPNGSQFDLPATYAVLCMGAGNTSRKWPVLNFVRLAQKIVENHKLQIVLVGTEADVDDAAEFEASYSGECFNLAGETSVLEYMRVVQKCSLLVSNDSSAPHIANAFGNIPTVVISNGFHFGRFVWEKPVSGIHAVALHPEFKMKIDNFRDSGIPEVGVDRFDISEISISQVYELVKSVLDHA